MAQQTEVDNTKLAVGVSHIDEQRAEFAYVDKHGVSLRGPGRKAGDEGNSFSGDRLELIRSELGIVVKTKSGDEHLARSATPVNKPNVMGKSNLKSLKLKTATGHITVDKQNINFIRAAEWDDVDVCPGCGIHSTHAEFGAARCKECENE